MHRDPTLRKRNALVIPGVLLVVACLAGIVYAQAVRPDSVECEDGKLVVFANACRSATLLLAIPLAIGLLLVGLGAAVRRPGTCHLGHGTTATTVLALLIAATALPALAAGYLYATQDADAPYTIAYDGTDYSQVNLLAMMAGAFLLALLPYLGLYACTAKAPRCCREKGCFEPCYCDEEPLGSTVPVHDNAAVTRTPWTGPSHEVAPIPASAPPTWSPPMAPAPANPPPAAKAPASVHDPWPAHAPVETPASESPAAPARKPAKKSASTRTVKGKGKKSA